MFEYSNDFMLPSANNTNVFLPKLISLTELSFEMSSYIKLSSTSENGTLYLDSHAIFSLHLDRPQKNNIPTLKYLCKKRK